MEYIVPEEVYEVGYEGTAAEHQSSNGATYEINTEIQESLVSLRDALEDGTLDISSLSASQLEVYDRFSDLLDPSKTSRERFDLCTYGLGFIGQIPYVWGGNSLETGVDCSGFVQQISKHFGMDVTSGRSTTYSIMRELATVDINDIKPGDLVVRGSDNAHVGVYIGNGQVMHFSTSSGSLSNNSKISALSSSSFKNPVIKRYMD